jgi:Zn-dependent peptidase ImmA (M78 family)
LRFNWHSSLVRAVYFPKADHYEIYIIKGMPPEYLRYYKCKELFHIVLDREALRTTDLVALLQNMITRARPESRDLDLGQATVSETLAEIAAAEFLLPYKDRIGLRNADGNIDYEAAAKIYGVPQWLVGFTTTKDYMAALEPFFGV